MKWQLVKLTLVFMMLSVLAVGGGTAVLPEMERATVHWFGISSKQFRDIYSIGQVAPGPNMMMVLLIGYRVSGWLGAALVGMAFFLPDCALTLAANRLWIHFAGSPWRQSVQQGLAPVAIGLMFAGTYAIAKLSLVHVTDSSPDFVAIGIAAAVTAILLWRHINPGILVLLGGSIYALLTR
jgi:chromate transporter